MRGKEGQRREHEEKWRQNEMKKKTRGEEKK